MAACATESNIVSFDKVTGTNVYDCLSEKLGTIDSLMIDRFSGKVRYAVLESGGILGMGADRYPLPWESLSYEPSKGGYVAHLTREQIENAPRYESGTAKEYTNEYGRSISDYYGVPYF